mgnify:FL=1
MKIASYLCNTFENLTTDSWQCLSENNIRNYFNKHNIPLNVIRFNDDRVQLALSALVESGKRTWNNNAAIRKIYRIYDFLKSDNDYGVFIDIDTLVLNRNIDIRNCINDGDNYIQVCDFGSREKVWNERLERVTKQDPMQYGCNYVLSKIDFANSRFPNATHKHVTSNTGFSVLNREFCTKFVKFLDENELNFNKKEHILLYYQTYPKTPYTPNVVCNDEFLFDAYMRSDENIINAWKDHAVKHEGQEKILCTDSYHLFEDFTMQFFIDKDPIFHHTLREKNTDKALSVMMRMFSV